MGKQKGRSCCIGCLIGLVIALVVTGFLIGRALLFLLSIKNNSIDRTIAIDSLISGDIGILLTLIAIILVLTQFFNETVAFVNKLTGKSEQEIIDGIKSGPEVARHSITQFVKKRFQPRRKTIFIICNSPIPKEAETIRKSLSQDKSCKVIYEGWGLEEKFLNIIHRPPAQKADHILFVFSQDFLRRLSNTEEGRGGLEEIKRLAARSPSSRQPGKGIAVLIDDAPAHREFLKSIGCRRFNSGDEWSIQGVRNMLDLEAPPLALLSPEQQTLQRDASPGTGGTGAGQVKPAGHAASEEIPLPIRIVPEGMKPYEHDQQFMERKITLRDGRRVNALDHIRDQFIAGAGLVALWGLPGVGKKELVREYIYSYGQQPGRGRDKPYRIVVWLDASLPLDDACKTVLERLHINLRPESRQKDSTSSTAADLQEAPPAATTGISSDSSKPVATGEKTTDGTHAAAVDASVNGAIPAVTVIDATKELKKWLEEQQQHFETNERWLLVLEMRSSVNLRALNALLPDDTRGDVLIIVEERPEGIQHSLHIEPLTDDEGSALLERLCGHPPPTEEERNAAREISRLLGGLPLAIKYATDYLSVSDRHDTNTFYRAYLRRCEQERGRLLQEGPFREVPGLQPVATVLGISLQAIVEHNQNVYRLLVACTLLSTEAIPETILQKLLDSFQEQVPASQQIRFHIAIRRLTAYSLLESDDNGTTWRLQPAIRMIIDDKLHPLQDTYQPDQYTSKVVSAVDAALPYIGASDWHTCHLYLPHIKRCMKYIEEFRNSPTASVFVHMLYITGCYLRTYVQFEAKCGMTAYTLLKEALRLRRQVSGDFYPDMPTCQFALAELHYERYLYLPAQQQAGKRLRLDSERLKRKQKALEHGYQKILAAVQQRERASPENVDEATVLYSLGRLYHDLGNYKAARQYFQEALDKWGRARSVREKLDRVICLNNLAMARLKEDGGPAVDAAKNNYQEAEKSMQEARDLLDEVENIDKGEAEKEQFQACRAQYLENYATLRVYGHYVLGINHDFILIERDYRESIRITNNALSGGKESAIPVEIIYLRLVTRWNNLGELYRLQGQAGSSREKKRVLRHDALESYHTAIDYWEKLTQRCPAVLVVLDNIRALRESMKIVPQGDNEERQKLREKLIWERFQFGG